MENLERTLGAFEVNIQNLDGGPGAQRVADLARGMAPYRTGRLRSSIGWRRTRGGGATIYANAPYAIYVEKGTRFMRARPFLEPALAKAEAEVVENYRKQVQDELENVRGA